jgi:type I restriction enzyme M protein
MNKTFKDYLNDFDSKYKDLKFIDKLFHEKEIGVVSFASKANTKDANGSVSEEYVRTRFVYALVNSGYFPKEILCIEFNIPKGNNGKALKPDLVAFKNKDWLSVYEDAKANKNFKKLRQNYLVIFETKKNNKSTESAIENQLRPALAENESKERVFGVYFDDKPDVLIFKKIGNSPIRRFDESIELSGSGLVNLNYDKRDFILDFPTYKNFEDNNKSISDVTKLTTSALDAIDEVAFEEFLAELKRIADLEKPKHSERDLIVEFLTLKVFDEKRSKRDKSTLKFYIETKEKKADGLGEKSFRERIDELYKDARREYVNVLSKPYFSYNSRLIPSNANEERFLIALVESLQKRAILKAKNESFNQIIFNNFGDEKQKADKGQFFTPIPVVKAIIQMLNPIKGEELCDPCCGICDFPAMAFRHAHRKDEEYPPNASHYYGFDIENNNLKLAELNLVLNGDGGAILENMNSISQKMLVDGSIIKLGNFTTNFYETKSWSHKDDIDKDLKKFKIIATNPPFGKGRDLKTGANGKWNISKETIELYETYKVKSTPTSTGKITLPKSMDMGVIFLENAYKLLEEGGRMGIVLSNSIASIKEWENVRAWLIERVRIVGLFDLPANTFGETGVATTIVIAYKPKSSETHLLDNDYEVFIKEVDSIGYEVKTVKRTITFKPQFLVNEETFEDTSKLDEDFTTMQIEFKEFLKRQELEIKRAFNFNQIN